MSHLAVILALAMLWTPHLNATALLLAAQVLAVAIVREQSLPGLIHIVAGLAVAYALHRAPDWFAPPPPLSPPPLSPPTCGGVCALGLGAASVVATLPFQPVSDTLSLMLAGLLLLATRRNPALHVAGLLELHNGLVLLPADAPLAGLPVLPGLALLGLWARARSRRAAG